MATLRSILHDLALVVLVTGGVLACLVLWKALGIESNVNAALATVNAPKSGTLSMLDDTIFQGRLTIDATNKVLLHEQNQLGTIDGYARNLDTEISGLADHSDTTLDSLAGSATQATKTLNTASTSLQTITDGITPVLASTKSTVDDVGVAVGSVGTAAKGLLPIESDTDTAVRGLLPLEANAATITGNLGATTTDFQTKFHVFLFPPPCKTFGCKVKRTWPYIKGGAEMVEPLYWGQQLFENRVP
jgi:ABC-type transporter Mla subunit MlaD